MGAHFRIPVVEAEWQQIAEYCDPLTVYMAAGGGERRYDQVDWREPWALIIGSEAHGVDQADMVLEGEPISIPMFRQTESLNAAVAAGVILFEATRQINFS
jgi:TrmH family RNA methyltransferase